jgi:hypothetical protein
MEQTLCVHCYDLFSSNPRNKNQCYCSKPDCQRARKAAWKRHKIKTDPEFKADHRLSCKKWAQRNPGYWSQYRKDNPHQAQRNRMLQTIRNRRRTKSCQSRLCPDRNVIAKVDASISNNFKPVGQFWLVPVIAKVDALKVNIFELSNPYR